MYLSFQVEENQVRRRCLNLGLSSTLAWTYISILKGSSSLHTQHTHTHSLTNKRSKLQQEPINYRRQLNRGGRSSPGSGFSCFWTGRWLEFHLQFPVGKRQMFNEKKTKLLPPHSSIYGFITCLQRLYIKELRHVCSRVSLLTIKPATMAMTLAMAYTRTRACLFKLMCLSTAPCTRAPRRKLTWPTSTNPKPIFIRVLLSLRLAQHTPIASRNMLLWALWGAVTCVKLQKNKQTTTHSIVIMIADIVRLISIYISTCSQLSCRRTCSLMTLFELCYGFSSAERQ